jgi:hypothetical protein
VSVPAHETCPSGRIATAAGTGTSPRTGELPHTVVASVDHPDPTAPTGEVDSVGASPPPRSPKRPDPELGDPRSEDRLELALPLGRAVVVAGGDGDGRGPSEVLSRVSERFANARPPTIEVPSAVVPDASRVA